MIGAHAASGSVILAGTLGCVMRTALALLLAGAAVATVAAPVPKAVKSRPTADGVWELVEFDGDNGRVKMTAPSYWMIEGDRISIGKYQLAELSRDDLRDHLTVRDPDRPELRHYFNPPDGQKRSAVLVLEGDTLRFAFDTSFTLTLIECTPGPHVYYYVFRRVK